MRSYTTKRIELPGGRFVEVVVFDEAAQHAPTPISGRIDGGPRPPAGHVGLNICPECNGGLVFPTAWSERRGSTWEITLRCPDCEHSYSGEYTADIVDHFDDALNDGTEQLLSDLRTFARVNMEEDVERLVRAITEDLILPMDF